MAEKSHEEGMRYIPLLFYILFSIMDSYASEHHQKRYLKPFLLPALFLFYLLHTGKIQMTICMAMAFGWIGDILLIHKTPLRMKAGTFSFLAGHIFYAAYFILHMKMSVWSLISLIAYLLTGILLEKKIMYDQSVRKRAGSIVYMCAIGIMSWCSFCAALTDCSPGNWISWIGTLLFIVSDSLILDQTVHHKQQKGVMETYTCAQLFIIAGTISQ